jgi:hypothetical protein
VQLHEHGDSQQAAQQQAEPGEQAAAQVHRCPLGVMNAGVQVSYLPPGNFSRKAGKRSRDSWRGLHKLAAGLWGSTGPPEKRYPGDKDT